jgi:AraC family transcriptional regulator
VPADRALLQIVRDLVARPQEAPLARIAARAGWSAFHLHRALRRLLGETPKQFLLGRRLDGAAGRLLAGRDTVLAVALDAGFASHEVFIRAFRRRFGATPTAYRSRAPHLPAAARERHLLVEDAAGPCLRLFRVPAPRASGRSPMPLPTIERRDLPAQPFLVVRRRASRAEIAGAIADALGRVAAYARQGGHAFAGPPFVRFTASGPGLLTLEAGFALAKAAPGAGEVEAGTLPAGPAACAVHAGAYEALPETHAALERWIEAQGLRPGGAPWEVYVTDPGHHPDPADWRTEVFWPLEA